MIALSEISDTVEVITDRLGNIDFCLFFTKLAIWNMNFKNIFHILSFTKITNS